jgi:GDP-fucose transporter C1
LLHLTALFGFFKVPEIRVSTCKGLTPLIAINCVGLAFNTYCLQYVDASFYREFFACSSGARPRPCTAEVARGLVLPFTTVLSYFILGTKSSGMLLTAIGVVCCGFLVGVANENLSVSGLGIFLGVLSSVTTAGHAIVVKRSLPMVNGSAMDLAYYSNFLSAFVMAPAALLAETGLVLEMFANGGPQLRTFWIGGLVTARSFFFPFAASDTRAQGIFGFLICIAGFVSIKVTSPVTHMISAAVRGVIQTVLGVWLFADVVTRCVRPR